MLAQAEKVEDELGRLNENLAAAIINALSRSMPK